jgi:NNP family nitrate/nitrite transporter-like MFS transporter
MFGTTLYEVYAYGFLLGIAGASFAVALPLASRWYPPRYQGLALGIAGAGNSGTVFATLFAPRLAEYFGGWHAVFGLAMIPVSLVLAGFVLLAKDAPNPPPAKPLREYVRMVRVKDVWLFCFFYSITFGGFVGMVSFLPLFFHEQYQLPTIRSGDFVTFCVIAGSFFRPIGGWLADKWGGVRILQTLFLCILTLFLCVSAMFSLRLELLFLLLIMASFGLGNGAVFQLVPQRFAEDIGIVTGIVGAAGGVGGFFLPSLLGVLKDMTGTYTPGFIVLAVIVGLALFTMLAVSQRWSESLVKKTSTGSAV